MNTKVVFAAIVMMSVLGFTDTTNAFAATGFIDVSSNDVNYQYIIDLQVQGKIQGKGNNQFGPKDSLTRAEFVTMIEKAFNVPSVGNKSIPFEDAAGWYQQAVVDAYYAKITNGTSATTFSPNQTLQRQEAATMIWNYLAKNNFLSTNLNAGQMDASDADSWAIVAIQNVLAYNLRSDVNTQYNSKATMNRGDAAALIDLAMKKVVSNSGMNGELKRRADQLISLFENGTIDIQYGYAEQLHDGRGITCGRAGFTTGTGDAYEVVQRYTDRVPNNILAKYLPELKRLLTATNIDDVSGLTGFSEAWSSLSNDSIFCTVQDQVSDELYYNPSVVHANDLGLLLPVSRAEIYDAIIQHGDGDNPDGLQALINQTNKVMGGSPKQGIDEKQWLNEFLDVRENDLLHPVNQSTQAVWSQSTGRIVVFRNIVKSGNYQLNGPIQIHTDDYDTTIQ